MKISAITLDLDDTLWPVEPAIVAAEAALREWILANCPGAESDWPTERLQALRAQVWTEHPHLAHDFSALRMIAIERILAPYGLPASAADEAFAVFFRARNEVSLYPEAREALAQLAGRVPIVALTNGNACLRTIGLDHYFHDAVHARDAGVAKPAAAIFHLACSRARAAPEQVLHVGDHPLQDVIGARQAGLQTMWLDRGMHLWPEHETPAQRCKDLSQLVEAVLPLLD
ncbi:MAG: HAD family hydrolase [Xanthomonadales bacterium]|nr:HAD family hydrolase [Xanthomonadales bacterium]